jgi:hypothetical protein
VLTLRLTRVAREPQGAIEDVPDLDAGQGEEAGSERRGRDGVSLAAVIETIAGQSEGRRQRQLARVGAAALRCTVAARISRVITSSLMQVNASEMLLSIGPAIGPTPHDVTWRTLLRLSFLTQLSIHPSLLSVSVSVSVSLSLPSLPSLRLLFSSSTRHSRCPRTASTASLSPGHLDASG